VKFIPEADSDFALTARQFASYLRTEPDAYGVSAETAAEIGTTVQEFRDVLSALERARIIGAQSPQLTASKDAARAKAEDAVRTLANIIRANPDVPASRKMLLRLKKRPAKLRKRRCPQAPPTLYFLGSGDGVVGGIAPGSGSGVHVLRFSDESNGSMTVGTGTLLMSRRAKPDGAVRIELYFDMVPAGDPRGVPRLPGERGWPKYLRSFTRSPIEVQFPIPQEPMLIVYWARWADSAGEVSRWSKPCVARVEGWTSTLPALQDGESVHRTRHVFIHTPITGALPDHLEGDAQRDEIALQIARHMGGIGRRMLEAREVSARMIDVA
jgi:hypothetical protein